MGRTRCAAATAARIKRSRIRPTGGLSGSAAYRRCRRRCRRLGGREKGGGRRRQRARRVWLRGGRSGWRRVGSRSRCGRVWTRCARQICPSLNGDRESNLGSNRGSNQGSKLGIEGGDLVGDWIGEYQNQRSDRRSIPRSIPRLSAIEDSAVNGVSARVTCRPAAGAHVASAATSFLKKCTCLRCLGGLATERAALGIALCVCEIMDLEHVLRLV